MQNILQDTPHGDKPTATWVLLLMLSAYVVGALFLFTFLAQAILLPFYDFATLQKLLTDPMNVEGARMPLIITQGIITAGSFIIVPILFIKRHLNDNLGSYFAFDKSLIRPLIITIFITLCFMVINSVVIEWNQKMELPDFLSGFESWAMAKEAQLEDLTIFLTDFEYDYEFIIALIVIAIIPGIGEELLFRGLIQNLFKSATGNIHFAIWISAILFSAFHMQFYGFLPRMLLGALFGYLYYWSGHLSIAMFAHFINNGFTLTMLYLSKQEIVDYNPMANPSSPPAATVVGFTLVSGGLLFLFWSYFKKLKHE
ncbi:MAG: CPBP family intramembrane glutamic endopeptidase [Cyclobacteriaceae bacterium]